LCFISVASAYTTQYYWSPGQVGYYIDSSVPKAYKSSVHAAASSWTNAGAAFDYIQSASPTNKVRYRSFGSGDQALGYCSWTRYPNSNRISSITIDLNSDYSSSWSTSSTCPSGKYDVQSVLAHEFGHGVGLGHSTVSTATMWPKTSSGSTSKRSLEQDDKNGIIAIYGT
jgi:hypothetical protein